MNNRRKLMVALGATALATPFASFAQQRGKVWRIGLLIESEPSDYAERINVFKEGMRKLGYLEGKDYSIEQRAGQSDMARISTMAAELVALKVDLILAAGTPSAVAAHKVTRDIPIVFTTAGDPVGGGLVATLQRPGGNVTGFANGVASDLISKRLDLLRQMLPGIRRVGFLYFPENTANAAGLKQFENDCSKLQLASIRAPLRTALEIPAAFDALKRDKAQGLIVSQANTNFAWKDIIVEHARKHRLPAIYPISLFAEAGGLIAYGSSRNYGWLRGATYVDKIFKGTKPAELPVEQPTKFDLVINGKTAKALGLKIPQSLLVQADKVIE